MASIIKRKYRVTLPDGSTEVRTCKKWTIQYRDAAGRIKRAKGYSDRGATKQLAATLEKAAARGEQGMIDPYKVHRARPIAEHVADYVADLRAAGRAGKYAEN